jgi:hypothetical protein
MADQFGAHDRRHGPRLEQIQRLGRGGLARLYVEAEVSPGRAVPVGRGEGEGRLDGGSSPQFSAGAARGASEGKPTTPPANSNQTRKTGDFVNQELAEKNKGGRPGLGKPWEAAGISRAEWFRRKKAGEGG